MSFHASCLCGLRDRCRLRKETGRRKSVMKIRVEEVNSQCQLKQPLISNVIYKLSVKALAVFTRAAADSSMGVTQCKAGSSVAGQNGHECCSWRFQRFISSMFGEAQVKTKGS